MPDTRLLPISFHIQRTIPISDLCHHIGLSRSKPILMKSLQIQSTIRHAITVVIRYCGEAIDTIPFQLEIGRNEIPIHKISMISAPGITQWSTIDIISENPRPRNEEPYEMTVYYTVGHPEHTAEDIRRYAQRVSENRALTNDFIDYLTE
jgi:hypothetical protein